MSQSAMMWNNANWWKFLVDEKMLKSSVLYEQKLKEAKDGSNSLRKMTTVARERRSNLLEKKTKKQLDQQQQLTLQAMNDAIPWNWTPNRKPTKSLEQRKQRFSGRAFRR